MPPSNCTHANAILVDNGTLRPDRKRLPFEAAWCPDCGSLREASMDKDPLPYQSPGTDNQPAPSTESIW